MAGHVVGCFYIKVAKNSKGLLFLFLECWMRLKITLKRRV